MSDTKAILKSLQEIPSIGPKLAKSLYDLGMRNPDDLAGEDAMALYERLCGREGRRLDRCVLYTFRCAVYYADTPKAKQDPELLKWWNWKD